MNARLIAIDDCATQIQAAIERIARAKARSSVIEQMLLIALENFTDAEDAAASLRCTIEAAELLIRVRDRIGIESGSDAKNGDHESGEAL